MSAGRFEGLLARVLRGRRGPRAVLVAVAALVAPAMACSDEDPFAPQVIEDLTFFPGLGVDLAAMTKLPSGVYIQDDSVGTGAMLADGDSVHVDLRGWLADGTLFGDGEGRFLFPGGLIDGFAIGITGMAEGGQRLMVIPPALGYGNTGSGPIPPGAVLVFEVELLDAY